MNAMDEFGKDPMIQRTRKLFSAMEKMDSLLLEKLGIPEFDMRLRTIREIRRNIYEKSFSHAIRKGIFMNENTALDLFTICQKIAINKCGISYDPEQPENPEMTALIQEAIK